MRHGIARHHRGEAPIAVNHPSARAADRLDLPPPPGAAARLPDTFGRRFALFADAEEEFDWSRPFDRAATTTTAIRALPDATRRFVSSGIVPTYLVDYPVATTPESSAIMADLAGADLCDLGAQLHPWVTPPYEEELSHNNSFAGNLSTELEKAKIAALTDAVTRLTGRLPIAYRAGRYGVGPATAGLLAQSGYRLDVSVRALFDYRGEGGPNFTAHPVTPWWVAGNMLEVPLSAVWLGAFRLRDTHARPYVNAALARTRLRYRVALTPEDMPLRDALHAIDRLLDDGQRLFSLSFHTPSLVPGHTPYVRDAADLRRFWTWWDGVLARFAKRGVTPVRADEILAAAHAARLARAPEHSLSGAPGPVAQG